MASKKARKSRDRTAQCQPEPRVERQRAARERWVVPLAIAAITVLVFLPVLGGDFVAYDDPENFLQNRHYRGLGWTQLQWMWTTTHLGHYVPLSWMTLGLYRLAVARFVIIQGVRQVRRAGLISQRRPSTAWKAGGDGAAFAASQTR